MCRATGQQRRLQSVVLVLSITIELPRLLLQASVVIISWAVIGNSWGDREEVIMRIKRAVRVFHLRRIRRGVNEDDLSLDGGNRRLRGIAIFI